MTWMSRCLLVRQRGRTAQSDTFSESVLGSWMAAGPLQYASHSRVLGCVPLDCVSQCAIDSFVSRSQSCRPRRVTLQQAFNPPPACFAVSLLASLASSQIPTPGTTLAETPPLEVCPAKVGPRYLVFHQHLSWVSGYHLRGSLHSDLNVECIATAIREPRNSSYSKYSVRVPSLRLGDSSDVR